MKVFDKLTGRILESDVVLAADRLMDMKKTRSVWDVIAEMITIWEARNPKEWQSYLVHLDDIKKTRKDTKFASTYDKQHGGYLRYTVDFPQPLMNMIRSLYTSAELPMDKKFFRSFGRRFPRFQIAEKQ